MAPQRWFITNGVFVCAPPKCGGTALYRAALSIGAGVHDRNVFSAARKRTEFFTPDEMAGSGRRAIMAARDPVSRFGSLWRDKCRDGDRHFPQLSGLSPHELMDFIEANPNSDLHWMPQSVHYRKGAELVDYRQLLNMLNLPSVEANRTKGNPSDPTFPIDRILAHYRSDVELIS